VSQSTDRSTGTSLVAETRTEFGKGAARRIRRDHKIPAVLYGHGEAPRHISLPGHATMLALKTKNALLALSLDGGQNALAIAKDVQIDPVRREIEHVDLVLVRSGERIQVEVAVHVTGEPSASAVVSVEANTLAVTAEATHLPEQIVVDVEGATPGTHILASQLSLPEGTELAGDPGAIVVSLVGAPSAADVEADLASSEADLGIQHDAPSAPAAEGSDPGQSATSTGADSQ
jgi:large subunit ribosomal protein L25